MNGMKALKGTTVALSLVAFVGCGQEYTPAPEEHTAAPRDAGDVNGSDPDAAPYTTLSYEALRSILTDVLGVVVDNPAALPANCNNQPAVCPIHEPILFLDANRSQLGIALYDAEPDSTTAPTLMSSGGFKLWIVSASSACGIAMNNTAKRSEMFPLGLNNYEFFHQALYGRSPSAAEVAELDALQSKFSTDAKKAAATCTVLLASLENLGSN